MAQIHTSQSLIFPPMDQLIHMWVCAGLVLMYESGIVMLDVADTTAGWLNDSDGAPQPDARCEFLLLTLAAARCRSDSNAMPVVVCSMPQAVVSMFFLNLWLGKGVTNDNARLLCTVAGDQIPVVACDCHTT